jgi:hypothetical protein
MHISDMAGLADDVRSRGQSGSAAKAGPIPLLTQAVWKRFSYPNNCKQPGAMDLEATG